MKEHINETTNMLKEFFWNAFKLKEIKEHVPLYNVQDVLKSLTVI